VAQPKEIVSVELGKECCKYAVENLKLNKIPEEKIKVIQGDVKKKVNSSLGVFDVIVMARPNLKDTFFREGLSVAKKGTLIYYYGFCHVDNKDAMVEELKEQAKESNRKIKVLNVEKSGDIAPFKFRWRIEIKVLN
jgi:tRNA G37 N-methylase Trm5